jgi:hypothetical protein
VNNYRIKQQLKNYNPLTFAAITTTVIGLAFGGTLLAAKLGWGSAILGCFIKTDNTVVATEPIEEQRTDDTPETSKTVDPIPTDSADLALNLPRVAWDGGPSYYKQFTQLDAAGWDDPTFFPVGSWFMRAGQKSDADTYKDLGFNTAVAVEADTDLQVLRENGIFAIHEGFNSTNTGTETIGWLLGDEADMTTGFPPLDEALKSLPQEDNPAAKDQDKKPNRLSYTNYGKGVMFWDEDSDAEKYVNNYTTAVSSDIYWYTDNDVCSGVQGPILIKGSGPISPYSALPDLTQSECKRSSNYGVTVDRMRALDAKDGKLQPIYNFVEAGNLNDTTIKPDQIAGAVMASLIHEARGILYFKHNFSGSCITTDTFIDKCYPENTAMVKAVNNKIKQLAPALNTQSYQYSFNSSLDTMLKSKGGSFYIFAMQKYPNNSGNYALKLPADMKGAAAEVMFENRSLPITNGQFSDNFAAEYSYHIYKITP